jgi:hypothetical protein
MIVMERSSDGALDENRGKRVGKDGIVCDVEASLLFDIDTAIELYSWLQTQLDAAEQQGLVSKDKEDLGDTSASTMR